ncbi:hypothetical protein GCM10018781_75060 [Kitasatospora indigofera]|uniref:Uncharacterized protein n=1 Tax=Kitasatospora indigofera TaxID=67307 RepID=A0A918YUX1_9ACTN|nr:DUF4279 domain-containing protein [Kitasatospora indigofera]GHE24626.1 hypothetical protein GCM10018781_75060 [Kitasatospora indigofera]
MPLRQYAYFALFSRHISADETTSHLGITPDEVSVRGSRSTEPKAIPAGHCWKVVCREPGLCADEQITRILDRLRPCTDRIAELAGRHPDRDVLDFPHRVGAGPDVDEYDMTGDDGDAG